MKMTLSAQFFKRLAMMTLLCFPVANTAQGQQAIQPTRSPHLQPGVQAPQPSLPTATLSMPDLAVRRFEVNGAAQVNGGFVHIPIKVVVHNRGKAGNPEKTLCGIRFGDQYVWSTFMMPLGENMTDIEIGVVKVPYSQAIKSSQQVVLYAVADAAIASPEAPVASTGRLFESNENNNERALVVNLATNGGINSGGKRPGFPNDKFGGTANPPRAKADLTITRFEPTGQVRYVGSTVEVPFRIEVRNVGSGHAGEKTVCAIKVTNQVRWSTFIPALKPGQVQIANGLLKINDAKGQYRGQTLLLQALADAAVGPQEAPVAQWGRIREANEQNNIKTMLAKVPGHKLVPNTGLTPAGQTGRRPSTNRPIVVVRPPRRQPQVTPAAGIVTPMPVSKSSRRSPQRRRPAGTR